MHLNFTITVETDPRTRWQLGHEGFRENAERTLQRIVAAYTRGPVPRVEVRALTPLNVTPTDYRSPRSEPEKFARETLKRV